jgi:hypothetical protein
MNTAAEVPPQRILNHALSWLQDRGWAIVTGIRPHLALYVIAFVTYAAGMLQNHMLGEKVSLVLPGIAGSSILIVAAGIISIWLLVDLVRLWRSGYAGSPTVALVKILLNDILTPGRIANGLHIFIATGFFAIGFTTLKSNIPKVNPFSWDQTFMTLDRELHFGVLPHELLAPLFQYPLVTFLVNVLYNGWFLLLMAYYLWQGFRDVDSPLRQRFFIAYFLCWVIGTPLFGTLFSSAGPCFYGRLLPGEPDPYAGLMTYLAHANSLYPIWAIATQDMLWDSYVTSKGVISGISAMPSMHVGTSVVFFLCARASGVRWLAWLTGIFAVMILLGSVLLAWHYAVDGYAGVLIAVGCWWLAGQWVKREPVSFRPS